MFKKRKSKQMLLTDLENVKTLHNDASISFDGVQLTVSELMDEIERETDLGKKHIKIHINAMKTIKKLSSPEDNFFVKFFKKIF